MVKTEFFRHRRRLFVSVAVFMTGLVAACTPWKSHESAAGKYKVEFPKIPVTETEIRRTPLGRVEMIWHESIDGETTYRAGYADLAGDKLRRTSAKRVLQSMQQLNAMDDQKKIVDVEWDTDLQGMRFMYLQEDGSASAHYYVMRKNRFYELQVVGPLGEVRGDDVTRFFSSLELL